MTALRAAAATVSVLWRRDLVLFFRQKSRLAGALAQPVLFWFVIGGGLSPTFRLGTGDLDYKTYFFPGVVLMIVLFSSIFATMSVIEDRHQGFLQGVLVAPGPRWAIVLGKSLGSATVSLLQAALFLLLSPLAGFPWSRIAWPALFVVLFLSALSLTAIGFAFAWTLDSTQGYHVVMSLVLIPLWVLSGAMFPAEKSSPFLAALVTWNPMSFAVSAARRALHGGSLPSSLPNSPGGLAGEMLLLTAAALFFLSLASVVAARRSVSN